MSTTTKKVSKEMSDYAKESMINLIQNISRQPIDCYSEKTKEFGTRYFLGRTYVENLIKKIKES